MGIIDLRLAKRSPPRLGSGSGENGNIVHTALLSQWIQTEFRQLSTPAIIAE